MILGCFCLGDTWLESAGFNYLKSGISISPTHSGNYSFSKNEGIKENE